MKIQHRLLKPTDTGFLSIIPWPQKVLQLSGFAILRPDVTLVGGSPKGREFASLQNVLRKKTGLSLNTGRSLKSKGSALNLQINSHDHAIATEGYRLTVHPHRIAITASSQVGIFYATQTLIQLIQPESRPDHWFIPCVDITDQPRFPWRGLMLDVGRHLVSVDEIKRLLDVMSQYKLNTFHWHLTEDQGWRVEIKKYPRLTSIGAWRKESSISCQHDKGDARRYGGFFTQREIREVVAYATARHIAVIPEIEMPGHCQAALAAYPKLSCTGGPFEVGTRRGVFEDVYCAGNDHAFRFLEDILTEIMDLFPSPFIHIGGDECPKTRWKTCPKCQSRMQHHHLANEDALQSYFIRHFDSWLTRHGRRLVGWDEILEGGLAEGAVVMSWRGTEGGEKAAQNGHDVVMTPRTHCYLDAFQSLDATNEPEGFGTVTPLSLAYSYEPIPSSLPPEKQKHVLGVQGCIWTECIKNMRKVEYMTFPRTLALAETAWTFPERKDFFHFQNRLTAALGHLKQTGVHYRKPEWVVGQWTEKDLTGKLRVMEWVLPNSTSQESLIKIQFHPTDGKNDVEIAGVSLIINGKEAARDTQQVSATRFALDSAPTFTLKIPRLAKKTKLTLRCRMRGIKGHDTRGDVVLL